MKRRVLGMLLAVAIALPTPGMVVSAAEDDGTASGGSVEAATDGAIDAEGGDEATASNEDGQAEDEMGDDPILISPNPDGDGEDGEVEIISYPGDEDGSVISPAPGSNYQASDINNLYTYNESTYYAIGETHPFFI